MCHCNLLAYLVVKVCGFLEDVILTGDWMINRRMNYETEAVAQCREAAGGGPGGSGGFPGGGGGGAGVRFI